MNKFRTFFLGTRQKDHTYDYVIHNNNGSVTTSQSSTSTTPFGFEWTCYLNDSAPDKPTYEQVLRTKFAWKAKYGTAESRMQRLIALQRRATLARNRELRSSYSLAAQRYKAAANRLVGIYNPYEGVTYSSVPAFRFCENSQQTHAISFGPGCQVVTNYYYWAERGNTTYVTVNGAFGMTAPHMFKDIQAFKGYPIFSGLYISDAQVASIIKNKILNDSRLLDIKDGQFSLLTFFAELGDVKSLPSLLKKWTRTSSDISDKYLGVSFGVLPFYSDVCAILDRLNNLPYAIEEWNRNALAGKLRDYHVTIDPRKFMSSFDGSRPLVIDASVAVGTYFGAPVNLYARTSVTQDVKIKGHVYLLPQVIPEAKIADLKSHIWGVDTPLSTAWEKIPFSFVVDWFLHLNKLIGDLESSVGDLSYRIVDAGYSYKITTTWNTSQGDEPGSSNLVALNSRHTYYMRRGLPTTCFDSASAEPYSITGLNAKQGTLAAALVHQQLKR